MKSIVALFVLFAIFATIKGQLPGYGVPPYGMMNMGYPPMGYPVYPASQPPPSYNPGYTPMALGTSETANANSNTNVNSNAGGGPTRWF